MPLSKLGLADDRPVFFDVQIPMAVHAEHVRHLVQIVFLSVFRVAMKNSPGLRLATRCKLWSRVSSQWQVWQVLASTTRISAGDMSFIRNDLAPAAVAFSAIVLDQLVRVGDRIRPVDRLIVPARELPKQRPQPEQSRRHHPLPAMPAERIGPFVEIHVAASGHLGMSAIVGHFRLSGSARLYWSFIGHSKIVPKRGDHVDQPHHEQRHRQRNVEKQPLVQPAMHNPLGFQIPAFVAHGFEFVQIGMQFFGNGIADRVKQGIGFRPVVQPGPGLIGLLEKWADGRQVELLQMGQAGVGGLRLQINRRISCGCPRRRSGGVAGRLPRPADTWPRHSLGSSAIGGDTVA